MSNSTSFLLPKNSAREESFETGQLFEKYIIALFNQRFFTGQKWRKSEKYPPGQMPSDHSGPDLEMILFGLRSNRFVVECKWRTQFKEGKLQWAEPHQLIRYQRFRDSRRIPFFVAIGVGGEPSKPDELFVTPLDYIGNKIIVCKSDLLKYEHKPRYRLYYDTEQRELW